MTWVGATVVFIVFVLVAQGVEKWLLRVRPKWSQRRISWVLFFSIGPVACVAGMAADWVYSWAR